MTPRFAVIIPCFNQAHFLRYAIDSVLQQSTRPEIIVVNDGSTDDTRSVAESYGTAITLINQSNSGLPAARNAGILASRGEYLIFLDSDDGIRPSMLQVAEVAIRSNPEIDVLHGVADVVDMERNVVNRFGGIDLGDDPFHKLLAGNIGPPNTFLVRRTLFSRAGLFDTKLKSCEDWDMWLRLAACGARFALFPSMVSVYRDVPGSMSKNQERMWRHTIQVIRKNQHPKCQKCRSASKMAIQKSAIGLRPIIGRSVKSKGDLIGLITLLVRNPKLAIASAVAMGIPSRKRDQ